MPIGAGVGALVGGALSAGGTVAGGLMQSGNAGKASAQAQRNLELVLPQMQTSYNQILGQYQPYTAGGAASTSDMQDLLGLNGPDAANAAMARFQTSPGYQWQLGQGLRAVDAGAAAQGMLRSGATQKAEMTYATGLADKDFGDYYNRLFGLSGQGLTAAGGIANANQNLIANETGNATAQNNAMIGGANAQNSILGNTFSSLGNTANTLFNNPQFQSWVGGSSGGGGVPLSVASSPGSTATWTGYVAPPAPTFS